MKKAADNVYKRQEAEFSYQLLMGRSWVAEDFAAECEQKNLTAQMAASWLAFSLVKDSVCAVTVYNAASSEEFAAVLF